MRIHLLFTSSLIKLALDIPLAGLIEGFMELKEVEWEGGVTYAAAFCEASKTTLVIARIDSSQILALSPLALLPKKSSRNKAL